MNILKVICAGILLVGCSPNLIPQIVRPEPVSIPSVDPLTLNRVEWQVLTDAQLRELISRGENVLYALDVEGYRALSLNLIEIRRYIDEQKAVIAYLRRILDERAGITTTPATTPPTETTPAPTTPVSNNQDAAARARAAISGNTAR